MKDDLISTFNEGMRMAFSNRVIENVAAKKREFSTGATRDGDDDKLDYEGFLSPVVLRRYAEYMHKNRVTSDGLSRNGDNWQKGIPRDVYMKSLLRHVMDMWADHRNLGFVDPTAKEAAVCGVIFNAMGYLFQLLQEESKL